MNTTEQIVEMFNSLDEAYEDIKKAIDFGWKLHTCVYSDTGVLVVYERERAKWN